MNIPAMQQLIRVLKAVPPEHFQMASVATLGKAVQGPVTLKDLHTCGSAACVIGYAAVDPWFQERGLELCYYGGIHSGVDECVAAGILGISDDEIDLIFVARHRLTHDRDMTHLKPQDMIEVVEAMIADHLAGRPLCDAREP